MKWLSAGLTFVNVATVCGLLGGLAGHGLNKTVALFAVIAGLVAALLAGWGTYDAPQQDRAGSGSAVAPAFRRYRLVWLWLVVAIFAIFAIRSFCNVLFIDGNELKIQSPNNLGDVSLHVTYIRNFASGVALWPDNPIYVFSKLRYPAGIDLFNSLLLCLDVDVIRGLVWVGLLSSALLCYALYRWGGTFTIAGFLFNGGLAGFQWLRTFQWNDYQGVPFIAWKSLALSMLVTQRGLLYALPVGLLLLYHWRAKFFPPGQEEALAQVPPSSEPASSETTASSTSELSSSVTAASSASELAGSETVAPSTSELSSSETAAPSASELSNSETAAPSASELGGLETVAPLKPVPPPPLPFWVELTLYATMPLFHLHTFMALSVVLLFLFFFLNGRARMHLAFLAGAAFLPATAFVWLITDRFHAGSVLHWNPGWVLNNGDFARPLAAFTLQPGAIPPPVAGFVGTLKHFVQFWMINFGLTLPLIIALLVLLILRAWKQRNEPARVKIRLISILAAFALLLVVLASLFAYLSLGSSLFVVLALIPPVAIAVMIPLFAFALQRDWKQTIPLTEASAFVIPAVVLFLFACFVKTAPWEWDNIKLIIWAYLIVLPFVWRELVSRWPFPVRAVVCVALFGSGFVTLFGGLAAGKTGFGLGDRTELDAVGMTVSKLPVEARYAAFPTYNHPLLLQGRKLILGYPGHVWTQGFNYFEDMNKLGTLMNGAPNWKETARFFRTRYLFWGREEIRNYPQSKRPWEKESKVVATGSWGTIYDIESPLVSPPTPQVPSPTPQVPSPTPQGQ